MPQIRTLAGGRYSSKERCSPINVNVASFLYAFFIVDLYVSSYSNSIEGISSFSFFLHSLHSIHNYCRKQGNGEDRLKCHQCMKKKFVVVPCTKCKKKMYCIQCIKQWYGIPCTFNFSAEMFFFPLF